MNPILARKIGQPVVDHEPCPSGIAFKACHSGIRDIASVPARGRTLQHMSDGGPDDPGMCDNQHPFASTGLQESLERPADAVSEIGECFGTGGPVIAAAMV